MRRRIFSSFRVSIIKSRLSFTNLCDLSLKSPDTGHHCANELKEKEFTFTKTDSEE